MKIDRFEDVVAWQKARTFNKQIFTIFSRLQNYSFKDQITRASLSISNNIAEGFERRSSKELRQFLVVARGSAGEVRSMLYTAHDLGYINKNQHQELTQQQTTIKQSNHKTIQQL